MSQAAAGGPRITNRNRDMVLNALRSGIVPAREARLIQVGREKEIDALATGIKQVIAGDGISRFVIGDYGSGKTFFLNLICQVAQQQKLVTMRADLTPDRRLQGTQGRARKLYSALVSGMGVKGKPTQALSAVVEGFITQVRANAETGGRPVLHLLRERLQALAAHPGGPTFAKVVEAYWQAYEQGEEARREAALRWLQAEYANKTEASRDLGVREIIDDRTIFDHLKLMAAFTTMAGYKGLLVCLDELVNLYKLSHKGARVSNYEQILNIINETQQGQAPHLGFLFGGTPDFLTDEHRGLYSYEALRSRLRENPFAKEGLVDYYGPVMRLGGFTKEHFFVLLDKVLTLYTSCGNDLRGVDAGIIEAFMRHCEGRVGDAYFRTPRTTLKEFIGLLDILAQNPGVDWRARLDNVDIVAEANPDLQPLQEKDDVDDTPLASFRL
ncbi:ATP-binding protein [Nocardiopsis sp. YSL2]|uniref:ATP-binding protein n=1 Tax=Nocardiopsis sp. YSL2 TaxID=2939492 RepID=UPI0026F46DCB|nr:ATP-binding protein [Nocardiopsis sp. YSL2]